MKVTVTVLCYNIDQYNFNSKPAPIEWKGVTIVTNVSCKVQRSQGKANLAKSTSVVQEYTEFEIV